MDIRTVVYDVEGVEVARRVSRGARRFVTLEGRDQGLWPRVARIATTTLQGTILRDIEIARDDGVHPPECSVPHPLEGSALHPLEGSARLPQSIDQPVGGLLPEAEGTTLMDEEEAFREYGLRSLGGDPEVWGDVSGEPLPIDAARAARAEEVAFMEEWG